MNKKHYIIIFLILISAFCLLLGVSNNIEKTEQNKIKDKNKITNIFKTSDKIILLRLNNVIDASSSSNFFESDTDAQFVLNALREVKKDASVKGVLLKINSPGGTVGMSQNIYDEIISLRKIKPIVVSMDDVAASGGYYIASAADRIYAQAGTLTGSIGVIFSTMDVHKLMSEKLSVKANVIKSGKFKDLGSPYKEMTSDEQILLQDMINDTFQQFKSAIIKGRIQRTDKYSVAKKNLDLKTLDKYADGRIFTGNQALKYGFVDGIGNTDFAYNNLLIMVKEKFKLSKQNLPLVPYTKYGSFSEIFMSTTETLFKNKTNILDEYIPLSIKMAHKPLYLWE